MNPGDGKAGRDKRREGHVNDLMSRSRIKHRRDRIDVIDLAIDNLETAWRIHPCIRRHDENAGNRAAHCHDHAAEPMD